MTDKEDFKMEIDYAKMKIKVNREPKSTGEKDMVRIAMEDMAVRYFLEHGDGYIEYPEK